MCNLPIKNDRESQHIPIIFVTALGRSVEREEGFKKGGDAYVSKLFEEDDLLLK